MGATGTGAQEKAQVQSNRLADDADQATVQAYYKNNLGMDVGGSYYRDNLDPKILARSAEPLARLVNELGKDVFDEMGIRIVSSQSQFMGQKATRAYAQTALQAHSIAVNPNKFNSYDTVKAQMHTDVHSGFHPTGCKAGDVLVHEVGHNLEFLINRRINGKNRLNLVLADHNQTYSKAIVQQAYNELKKEQPSLFSTEKQARRSISGYADSLWQGTVAYTECLAEAVADYGRNGQNAKPMSIKIWNGIKEMLK